MKKVNSLSFKGLYFGTSVNPDNNIFSFKINPMIINYIGSFSIPLYFKRHIKHK